MPSPTHKLQSFWNINNCNKRTEHRLIFNKINDFIYGTEMMKQDGKICGKFSRYQQKSQSRMKTKQVILSVFINMLCSADTFTSDRPKYTKILVWVLAAASCHAGSRLFGKSECVISPDPALQGTLAPPAISPEPQRLNGQVIDVPTHTRAHTHNLPTRFSISSP